MSSLAYLKNRFPAVSNLSYGLLANHHDFQDESALSVRKQDVLAPHRKMNIRNVNS